MKRFIISIFTLYFCFSATAQIEQGATALMGGFHVLNDMDKTISGTSTFYNRTNNTTVDIGGMYAITSNIAVGTSFLLNNNATLSGDKKDDLLLQNSGSQAGLRLFGRYYHPCFAPRFYTFGQVYFAFLTGHEKSYDFQGSLESKDNASTIGAGINTGFSYFLIPAIALEMNFGLFNWNQSKVKNNDGTYENLNNTFQLLALSKTLTIGFCWYLGRQGGF